MTRHLLRYLCVAACLAVGAGVAAADVKLRVAVAPDTLPQCYPGHGFVAVANTGAHPIGVRVCIALVHQGTGVVRGPMCGRLLLAAGEHRQREFTFSIPGILPTGPYALVARAAATDGTSDQAAAPFYVAPSPCVAPTGGVDSADALLNGVLTSMGATPEATTPTQPSTWGSLKIRYR